jgi:hypothetical protein
MLGALEAHVGLCLLFLIYSCVKLASSPTDGENVGIDGCGGDGGRRRQRPAEVTTMRAAATVTTAVVNLYPIFCWPW